MKGHNILFVATVDMFSNTGGGIATRAFYNAYKNIFGDKVKLMHAEDYYVGDKSDRDVVLIKRRSKLFKLINFLKGHVHRFYPDILRYLKAHYQEYSECVINGGVYAGDSIQQIKELGLTVTVIHHNFERQYHLDNKTIASFWGKSAFLVNFWERKAYKYADNNLFLTKYDMQMFEKVYGESIGINYCIGCFMPSENYVYLKHSKSPNNNLNLVISGALDFPQSYNSVIQFYWNIFQKIDNRMIKLTVTGRNPSNELIKNIQGENITIIPSPKDIYNIINEADVYICPIDCGGGIKMRIMDGLKCGKPIITHINSVRGYEYFLGKNYFYTYTNSTDFLKVLDIVKNKLNRKEINSNTIKRDFLNYFNLSSGTERLKNFYNKNLN
ncbi:MAG: glycosyltransferase [Muribaculum sp.]|nr:glycosyltransferase [Muribaculum sp.]